MPKQRPPVRFAVVGQGYFAQSAILPAFASARNARLVALVSDSHEKREELARKYEVEHVLGYDAYDDFLAQREVDAVYIALPNSKHADFAVRAARAGVHVLCEKPLAVTEAECQSIIGACEDANVKLMTAYRLHFEAANLSAVEIARSGKIGELRAFSSVFTMQVREGNIRLDAELGGGPLYDIGIYCINAARYLFRDEPVAAAAFSESTPTDARFREVDEQVGFVLRFPKNRLATILVGFGAADASSYELVGSEGILRVDPAYEFASALKHTLKIGKKEKTRSFKKRDQVAPEIAYFAECIQEDREPEPNGYEGLADVRVIRAVQESARARRIIDILPYDRASRPDATMERHVSPHREPKLVGAQPPSN